MNEELKKKIANILLQEIEGGFCSVPKMQKFNIAANAIVKYLHPQEEQQLEEEKDKWKDHDRESLLWHLAIRDVDIEKLKAEIQKLREERDGWEQTAQRFLNQNCSLVDERDRSNTSFKKMSDLFDQKIQEARDYRAVLQEVWDNRSSTFLLESFKRVINVLSKYPSIPTTKE